MNYLNPANWAKPSGFSNGVLAEGRMLFVAGQVGWDGLGVFHTDDFVEQAEQALRNIVEILEAGGAGPEHIARMTWYVTDKRDYVDNLDALGQAYRRAIGRYFPAMTLVQVVALVEDRAKVEIEVTAILPG